MVSAENLVPGEVSMVIPEHFRPWIKIGLIIVVSFVCVAVGFALLSINHQEVLEKRIGQQSIQ